MSKRTVCDFEMEPFCECSLPYWCPAAITNLLRGHKIYDNFVVLSALLSTAEWRDAAWSDYQHRHNRHHRQPVPVGSVGCRCSGGRVMTHSRHHRPARATVWVSGY